MCKECSKLALSTWRAKNRDKVAVYHKNFTQTLRGKYTRQKAQANYRGIPWELTYDEWFQLWDNSGKLDSRGATGADSYCMCRTNDTGPYASHNVRIDTFGNNMREAQYTRYQQHKGN